LTASKKSTTDSAMTIQQEPPSRKSEYLRDKNRKVAVAGG